jgi:phosphoenolpyruvate carboxylase
MEAYAGLVEDPAVRGRLLDRILEEFDLTSSLLRAIFQRGLEERRPRMYKTLRLRDAPLHVLHMQQIALLRQWRSLEPGDPKQDALLQDLLLSINAIAAGLRTTG